MTNHNERIETINDTAKFQLKVLEFTLFDDDDFSQFPTLYCVNFAHLHHPPSPISSAIIIYFTHFMQINNDSFDKNSR